MWETEQFWGTIDFHSIYFPTMEVNGAPKTAKNFLQNIFLCVRQNKDIHAGLEPLEGEYMMTEFSFLGALSL